MKKKLTVAAAIIAAFVLLFPRRNGLDDGGSIVYAAPLYSVTQYHMMDIDNSGEYLEGWGVEILGIQVYYNVS